MTTTYADGSTEQLGYTGNILSPTSDQRRDGTTVTLNYDARGNPILALNGAALTYDNKNKLISATLGGATDSFTYNALGARISESSPLGTFTFSYDADGRRTRITWPDTFYVAYTYDNLGEMTAVQENGATSGLGLLATYSYDNLGERVSAARGNGTSASYGWDPVSRLASLANALGGGASRTEGLGYNAANDIDSRTDSNDAYTWGGSVVASRTYTPNILNQ